MAVPAKMQNTAHKKHTSIACNIRHTSRRCIILIPTVGTFCLCSFYYLSWMSAISQHCPQQSQSAWLGSSLPHRCFSLILGMWISQNMTDATYQVSFCCAVQSFPSLWKLRNYCDPCKSCLFVPSLLVPNNLACLAFSLSFRTGSSLECPANITLFCQSFQEPACCCLIGKMHPIVFPMKPCHWYWIKNGKSGIL